MSAHVLDTFKLLASLKATGKDANYTAEEIVGAIDVAQDAVELVTVPIFESRMRVVDARLEAIDQRFDALEEKLDARFGEFRADIKAEVRSSQVQSLLWLSGIMLASNGAVIALLGRVAKLY